MSLHADSPAQVYVGPLMACLWLPTTSFVTETVQPEACVGVAVLVLDGMRWVLGTRWVPSEVANGVV